jgi:hypothetical protein
MSENSWLERYERQQALIAEVRARTAESAALLRKGAQRAAELKQLSDRCKVDLKAFYAKIGGIAPRREK